MSETKSAKHTINYTDEDVETWLTNQFIKMIIQKQHPDVETQARELAREYMQQSE